MGVLVISVDEALTGWIVSSRDGGLGVRYFSCGRRFKTNADDRHSIDPDRWNSNGVIGVRQEQSSE